MGAHGAEEISTQRWLPDMDLNHDKQIQSLLCYRYTIGQGNVVKLEHFRKESRHCGGVGTPLRNPQSAIRN